MKSYIKVLHVFLDDRVGGAHSRFFSIFHNLKSDGIESIMVLPDGNGEANKLACDAGITSYKCKLGTPHYIRNFKSVILNIKYIFNLTSSIVSLIKIIKSENIDIVHINGLLAFQGAIASLLCRKRLVCHLFYPYLFPGYIIKMLSLLLKISADKVIHISLTTKKHFKINSGVSDTIIYEPVNLEKFNPDKIPHEKIRELKKDFGIRDEEIIIGTVGNLTWVKGYENLIEAVAIVSKKYKNIELLIAGKILDTQIEYYQRLKKLVSSFGLNKKVNFLGWRTDTPEILSLMDIFVLPSIMEGTPISILEAMSMKIPVIASDVGGIHEQIIDGETGILVSPNEPSEIALSILNLLESSKKRKEMGDKARKLARKKFSIESCAKAHKKLYREVLRL
jgi:glycosyltransferase involved in cell wall biosynthesis